MKYCYPKEPNYEYLKARLVDNMRLMYEYGASKDSLQRILDDVEAKMKGAIEEILALEVDKEFFDGEPNDLDTIKALSPSKFEKGLIDFDWNEYKNRLKGAFIGRMAGCTLGAPVEFWEPEKMENFAKRTGDVFPNEDYWLDSIMPTEPRYTYSTWNDYTKDAMDGVPCDDDITYTILGLLMLEDYGINLTTDDVGKGWVKYLPMACTAEEIALKNLKEGIDSSKVAEVDNPFVQWIGADIRSDPWGYVCPGNPEKAAELAYMDAYISHRKNGIYGEMYFSAAIALAFTEKDVIKALEKALDYIPANCLLAADMRWALEKGPEVKDYMHARELVKEYFDDMCPVHTNINAALTVFGLFIGKNDFSKTISQVVAMGYDNDCTAATAGSLLGAAIGFDNIPEKWYKNFNNKVITYINDNRVLAIDDLLERFEKVALKIKEAK